MVVLYCALGALAALIAVLLINTAVKCSSARKLEGSKPEASEEVYEKYGLGLANMLACKTVSVKDSYDDTEFAKLREVVEKQFPLLHKHGNRQILAADCWLYKIEGKDPTRNILLMSHHDVVDVSDKWTHEPFSVDYSDGKVWGRGAADTKGSLAAILFAVEELLEEGFVPPVNLYVASSHNEELGGDGITTALQYFKDNNITLEVIFDEGGAIVDSPLGKMKCDKCSMVAVHEKGRLRLVCKAESESSHVSLTAYKNNPVERMGAFIQDISTNNIFIRRMNRFTKEMFTRLAPYCSFPMNVLFCNLWLFGGLLTKLLPKLNATAGGMIGTTCAFQTIEGKANDKYCTATAMLRNINEEDAKADLEAFKKVAAKYGITVEIDRNEYYPPVNMDSKAYAYAMECIEKVFPIYPAAPYVLPAGTDAWRLTPVCDCVIRFAPTRMSKQQLASIHAEDENIDASAIYEGAQFFKYFVKNYK